MAQSKDGIQGLERNRARLEENVRKLKASLNRWQAWEIEYEGLKEDVLGLRHDASPIKLVNKLLEEIYDAPFNTVKETLENFETSLPIDNGELSLTPNEKREIIRDETGRTRNKAQILSIISRRLDYVQQSTKTLSSQLDKAEQELTTSVVLNNSEPLHGDDLPITEIREDLDEEGNIISSSTSRPPILDQKALFPSEISIGSRVDFREQKSTPTSSKSENGEDITSRKRVSRDLSDQPRDSKSFSKPDYMLTEEDQADNTRADEVLRKRVKPADAPPQIESAKTSNSESTEDTALRQEMLRYNMEEIGAVVAEIDLDGEGYGNNDSELENEFEDSENENHDRSSDDEEFEEEDIYGRASTRVLSDDYLVEMRALEKRLSAQAMLNAGPGTPQMKETSMRKQEDGLAKDVKANESPSKSKKRGQKGVRFAEELDIQEAPKNEMQSLSTEPLVSEEPSERDRLSRLLQTEIIVERPPSSSEQSPHPPVPSLSDGLDPAILQHEVRNEYHRLRNRQIQREGGFLTREEEKVEVVLTEAEGGPKKVSRFKAARLGTK